MPKFKFECKCGCNFTRNLAVGNHQSHECPACHTEASRVLESFGFNFAAGGSAPANSGVAKLDYPTGDQIVGSDADKRWGIYNEREKTKAVVRKKGGSRVLVRQNGSDYIEYAAGGQSTLEVRKGLANEVSTFFKRPET